MEAGREARLTGLEEDNHGVKIPVLGRSEEESDHLHRRQIGQYNFICKGDMRKLKSCSMHVYLTTIYQIHLHLIHLNQSLFMSAAQGRYSKEMQSLKRITMIFRIPGASEGLFARVEIETGTTIAFYNGSRADPGEFNPDTWETNNYR